MVDQLLALRLRFVAPCSQAAIITSLAAGKATGKAGLATLATLALLQSIADEVASCLSSAAPIPNSTTAFSRGDHSRVEAFRFLLAMS